jgi:HK97 gp10 family phage protein
VARPRVRLESNFAEVKKAAGDTVDQAVRLALNVGEGEAEKRLERIDDTRGYELPIDIVQQKWRNGGKIIYEPFYGRWFEYGTVRIPAAPFMRPAHRKMRKVFVGVLSDSFDGWVRRRARVRRR